MIKPPRRLRDTGTGMSMIVKTVTRWLKGPIMLFGIYLVAYGHITPGGGFGGGEGSAKASVRAEVVGTLNAGDYVEVITLRSGDAGSVTIDPDMAVFIAEER